MTKTLSIKIHPPKDTINFVEKCNTLFNEYIEWSFKEKTYNKNKCHNQIYFLLREKHPDIPSALLQSIRDTALESVKALKFLRRPVKGKWSSLRYDKRTVTLRGNQLSICLGSKRHKEILNIPDWCKKTFDTWQFSAAQLCYRSKTKQFYVNLIFKKDDPKPSTSPNIIGIDRGLYNIAVTSSGKIFSNHKIRKNQRKYLFNRRRLQAKGTHSAKRRLRAIAGKEKRFSKDVNHCVSKKIARLNASTFVLEDLTSIRSKRRGKKLNKWISSWPFFQLEQFLAYKAQSLGKTVAFVDAKYTSQSCSRCGHRSRHNRIKSMFKCSQCGFMEHADINAAINIRDKYLLSIANRKMEQGAVNHPYATKAFPLVASSPACLVSS